MTLSVRRSTFLCTVFKFVVPLVLVQYCSMQWYSMEQCCTIVPWSDWDTMGIMWLWWKGNKYACIYGL